MANLIKVDRNGTKYYEGYKACERCQGRGLYAIGTCNGELVISHVDNGVCWECGGSGKTLQKWKEYTPEYEAKLEERRAKRRAKQEAEAAEERARLEAERLQKEAEEKARQEAEAERIRQEKAKSQYIGAVGDKVEVKAIYKFSAFFEVESYAGFGKDLMYIHNFKVGDNTVIWKTTASLGRWNDEGTWESIEEESEVTLKGTIKYLSEYKDEKQTVLTRCKVTGA